MEILQTLDIQALVWIAAHIRCSLLTPVMLFLTHLCDHGEIWLTLALILLLRPRTRACGASILLAMLLSLLLGNGVIKNLVARPRPFAAYPLFESLLSTGGYSFPSGHTLSSFCAATAVFHYYRKPAAAAYLLAALIGFTRLYVGVHYPTDVLAGAVLGIVLGTIAALLVKHIAESLHYARLKRADIPETKHK